jgi:hypothetical protein
LLERVKSESFWLRSPAFADKLVWCEAFEGLEALGEVVGANEVIEVAAELLMAVVVIALDFASLMVRFILSTRPFVQGWLILVKRCSMPFSRERMSNMWVMKVAVGPSA